MASAKRTLKASRASAHATVSAEDAVGVMPIRQIYDVLRLSAPVLLTRASALLQLDSDQTTPSEHGAAPVPSVTVVFAAADHLHRLTTAPVTPAAPRAPQEHAAAADTVATLSRLLAWFCLATTPHPGRTRASNGELASSTSASTSPSSRGAASVTAWTGSRMGSTTPHTVLGAPVTSTFNDAQLAAQLVRPAVYAVARYASYGLRGTTPYVPDTARVRESVLWLFAALVRRFGTDWGGTALLPLLFPSVQVRSETPCHHPVLTPLLWECETGVRHAAGLVVVLLLRVLHKLLRHAAEPEVGRQTAFASLAAQSSEVLRQLHDGLDYGLERAAGCTARVGCTNSDTVVDDITSSKTDDLVQELLTLYAALVPCTPYERCPRSRALLLHTLQLPVLRRHWTQPGPPRDEGWVASLAHNATMNFLVQVLHNESLLEPISALLARDATVVPTTCVDDSALDAPWLALVDGLLAHAMDGVEAWDCVVQLARLYPSVVQAHFDALLDTAARLVRRCVHAVSGDGGRRAAAVYVAPGRRPAHGSFENAPGPCVDATAMCLRGWLHFMGYVWHAFDSKVTDPAFRPAARVFRATVPQKRRLYRDLLQPLVRHTTLLMTSAGADEVLLALLRCLAQIGEDYVASCATLDERDEWQRCAMTALTHWSGRVRAEAMTTVSMWLWQYPSLDKVMAVDLVNVAVTTLRTDYDGVVRAKAAFALSNASSRVVETGYVLRAMPAMVQTLCDVAMHAVDRATDTAVQNHGMRMMSHLLQVLSYEELIAALSEHEEVVAEGFMRVLLQRVQQAHTAEPKQRWNAACAMGMGLARSVVFEAEPRLCLDAVAALVTAVESDEVFKVRTQAAHALAKVNLGCLGRRFGDEDWTPRVVRALCEALVRAAQTESFDQYRDQAPLQAALKAALQVMITTAASSNELEKVFSTYKQMLTKEGLL